ALRGGRRLRQAAQCVPVLHLLVYRRAGQRRTARRGAGAVREHPGASQPSGPAVGGYRAGDRHVVGQLPADLFPGRIDFCRDAHVALVGGGAVARLVVVSNRLPLPSERGPRAGGLAVALADALRPGSLWFGWSGRRVETPAATPVLTQADGITYATIDMTEAEYRAFYVGFANGALWPLLHFRLDPMTYRRAQPFPHFYLVTSMQ